MAGRADALGNRPERRRRAGRLAAAVALAVAASPAAGQEALLERWTLGPVAEGWSPRWSAPDGPGGAADAPDLGDQTKTYRPSVLQGPDDINEDALFVDIEDGDFRLTLDSPAIDAGTNAIGPELLSQLFDGSTSPTGQFDSPPVDLGYHYPVVPTPEPEP